MPNQLWQSLERLPGLADVEAGWRELVGEEFSDIKTLLRPTGEYVTSYPCTADRPCSCRHDVIEHGPDDIVSICRCDSGFCGTSPLKRSDIVLYEMDCQALAEAASTAIGASREFTRMEGFYKTFRIGTYSPGEGVHFPVFLTIQLDSPDVSRVIETLLLDNDKPFILMAPTREFLEPKPESFLDRKKCVFLALSEVLVFDGEHRLAPKRPAGEILAGFLAGAMPGAPQGSAATAALATEYPKDARVFLKQGKRWLVVYDGDPKGVDHMMGMDYIRLLLQSPGQEIHASTLRSAVAGEEDPLPLDSAGEMLDPRALREYNKRISEIDEDLAQLAGGGDFARIESLTEEREALLDEVGRATGLRGTRDAGSNRERHRQAVSRAIHRALLAIKAEHEALWQHLQNSLTIGEFLAYRPDQTIPWTT